MGIDLRLLNDLRPPAFIAAKMSANQPIDGCYNWLWSELDEVEMLNHSISEHEPIVVKAKLVHCSNCGYEPRCFTRHTAVGNEMVICGMFRTRITEHLS